jgi:hypothetical protein
MITKRAHKVFIIDYYNVIIPLFIMSLRVLFLRQASEELGIQITSFIGFIQPPTATQIHVKHILIQHLRRVTFLEI